MIKRLFRIAFLSMTFASSSNAYTVITVSTGAPQGLESQFIAQTTAQFTATVTPNPFFAGTQSIVLEGANPNYNPQPTNADLLNALVAVSTYGYVYGYAGGMVYQNQVDSGLAANLGLNCAVPSNFTLTQTSATTFDNNTCVDVITNVLTALYQVTLSTPPALPFEP